MRKVALLSIFLLFSFFLEAKIKIVFRYDDYRLINGSFDDTLVSIFLKKNIPICLGIVPFDQNGNPVCNMENHDLMSMRKYIKTGQIDIALHGYSHLWNKGGKGEFSGLDYADQLSMIQKSKVFLDSTLSTHVIHFIPPWNSYDENTLKALEASGFKSISSALYGNQSGVSSVLKFIPHTLADFKELNSLLTKHTDDNLTIVLMIHHYNFISKSLFGTNGSSGYDDFLKIKPITLDDLKKILDIIVHNKLVEPVTFTTLANKNEDFTMQRMNLNTKPFLLKKMLSYSEATYLPVGLIQRMLWVNRTLYALTFLLFFTMTFRLIRNYKRIKGIIILVILSLIPTVTLVLIHLFSPVRLLFITFLLAVISGLLLHMIVNLTNRRSIKDNNPV